MPNKQTLLLATRALVVMLIAATVNAQDLSESSTTTPDSSDTELGASIGNEADKIADSVPELREADRSRDTRNRGSFVGADSDGASFFDGDSKNDGKTTGQRSRQRARARDAYRPDGRRSQSGRSRGTTLRPRLALGFHYAPKPSPQLAENVRVCIKRIPSMQKNSSIRVSVQKNVVILEGTVANSHDRALAKQLVALSPGVTKIDNRIKVNGEKSP